MLNYNKSVSKRVRVYIYNEWYIYIIIIKVFKNNFPVSVYNEWCI